MENKYIEFCAELVHESYGKDGSDGAYLVNDGDEDIWIPKSQCRGSPRQLSPDREDYEFEITEWIALKKGII
jgi:hypothetical protein